MATMLVAPEYDGYDDAGSCLSDMYSFETMWLIVVSPESYIDYAISRAYGWAP